MILKDDFTPATLYTAPTPRWYLSNDIGDESVFNVVSPLLTAVEVE